MKLSNMAFNWVSAVSFFFSIFCKYSISSKDFYLYVVSLEFTSLIISETFSFVSFDNIFIYIIYYYDFFYNYLFNKNLK